MGKCFIKYRVLSAFLFVWLGLISGGFWLFLSNNQVRAEDTINFHSQISATPGITTPSTTDSSNTVRFTVRIPELYDNLSKFNQYYTVGDPNYDPYYFFNLDYSIAIYISDGPGGDYKQIDSRSIEGSNYNNIATYGYTYPWTVPIGAETGTYKYLSKLFTKGVYIDNSKSSEGQLQIKSNNDDLACQEGCQLAVSIDNSNVNAGDKVTFHVRYHDNTTTSSNYSLKMWVSADVGGGAVADYEKCDATIRNDNTEVVCQWQTNTGTAADGGTKTGAHNVVAKVFYTAVAGNPMDAYWSGIVNVINPDAPADRTGGVEGLNPETDLTGPGPLNFGNPFDADTLAGKITSFAIDTIGIFAFFAFIIGGFFYLTAGGDPAKAEKAKKTMLWSIVALVVLVLSYSIITIVINIINNIFG